MNLLSYPFRIFRSRSHDRDSQTDSTRAADVTAAIDKAIADAQAEHAGLQRRLEAATTMAAMAAGNGVDEYVDRDASRTDVLRQQEDHIRNATARLRQLDRSIADLNFLRETCIKRLVRDAEPSSAPETAGLGLAERH